MARLFDDGSSEYLEVDSTPLSAWPVTMACWFYNDSIALRQALICVTDVLQGDRYFALLADGSEGGDPVDAWARYDSSEHCFTSAGYSASTWHHATGVWASNTERYSYLDGGNKGTDVDSVAFPPVDRVSIGRLGDSSPSNYISGRIAEAAIWTAALTDAEVASLAAGFSPLLVRPQSLVAYWPLIRDEDQDRVGGYDLTAYNTPSIAAHPPIIYPAPPIFVAAPTAGAPANAMPQASHHYQTRRL